MANPDATLDDFDIGDTVEYVGELRSRKGVVGEVEEKKTDTPRLVVRVNPIRTMIGKPVDWKNKDR